MSVHTRELDQFTARVRGEDHVGARGARVHRSALAFDRRVAAFCANGVAKCHAADKSIADVAWVFVRPARVEHFVEQAQILLAMCSVGLTRVLVRLLYILCKVRTQAKPAATPRDRNGELTDGVMQDNAGLGARGRNAQCSGVGTRVALVEPSA